MQWPGLPEAAFLYKLTRRGGTKGAGLSLDAGLCRHIPGFPLGKPFQGEGQEPSRKAAVPPARPQSAVPSAVPFPMARETLQSRNGPLPARLAGQAPPRVWPICVLHTKLH